MCKMYSVIEFSDEEGGGVAIVHCKWFTPRKKEVFWPPYKDPNAFNRALIKGVDVSEDWKLFKINRNFYETDDLEKAKRKLKLSELTSDLNTDAEEKLPARRPTKKPRRIIESSDDDEEISKFERPPKIVKVTAKKITEKTREGAPLQEDIVDTLRCQRQDYINKNFYNSPISSSATYDSTPNYTSRFSLATRENSRLTPHSEIEQSVQGQILKHLVILREQNEQILSTLQKFSKETSQHITTSVPKFPVSLPLSDLENLKEFENYLLNEQNFSATSAYLSSLGGNTIASRTNRILRQLLEDRLASTYNFFGSRNKEAFNKLQLTRLIIGSLKFTIPQITEKEVEDAIKTWLKHAPERMKKKLNSNFM
ncbi:hypothetical protein RN001_010168 [Aquatica leii]|uniref:DUF4806 domain-containing protein n=1 Tax=Aquatica leii TaxID=1421715 RepID=A0AAN7P669_9COLE|nr:hypothetical protein RN001_010168 [Aquatica leii]